MLINAKISHKANLHLVTPKTLQTQKMMTKSAHTNTSSSYLAAFSPQNLTARITGLHLWIYY